MQDIQKIILGKAEWILKTQREQREAISEIKPKFNENSTLPYLGKNYPLRILRRQAITSFDFVNGHFEARILGVSITRNKVERLYNDWLMHTSYHLLKEKVDELSANINTVKEKIYVKQLRNREKLLDQFKKTGA